MNAQTNSSTRPWFLIGGFIVISIAISVVWFMSQFNREVSALLSKTDQPVSVALHYYEAMRNQNYALAYADFDGQAVLNGQPIDKQTFITLATQADSKRGAVLGYNLLEAEGDTAGFSATLKRGSQSYTQHIHLEQTGGTWKIGSIDGL